MDRKTRSNIALGLVLIIVGAYFLARQFLPQLPLWDLLDLSWHFYIIAAGILLFLIGLLSGVPSMAVPAALISGIGALLYWQDMTNNWESWAYAWTLIPGFAGIGTILQGLLGEKTRQSLHQGFNMVIVSLILFSIFASILGGWQIFGPYWPVLIILLGLWMIIRVLINKR